MKLGRITTESKVRVKTTLRTSKVALSIWAINRITGVHTDSIKRILNDLMTGNILEIEKIKTSDGDFYRCKK